MKKMLQTVNTTKQLELEKCLVAKCCGLTELLWFALVFLPLVVVIVGFPLCHCSSCTAFPYQHCHSACERTCTWYNANIVPPHYKVQFISAPLGQQFLELFFSSVAAARFLIYVSLHIWRLRTSVPVSTLLQSLPGLSWIWLHPLLINSEQLPALSEVKPPSSALRKLYLRSAVLLYVNSNYTLTKKFMLSLIWLTQILKHVCCDPSMTFNEKTALSQQSRLSSRLFSIKARCVMSTTKYVPEL